MTDKNTNNKEPFNITSLGNLPKATLILKSGGDLEVKFSNEFTLKVPFKDEETLHRWVNSIFTHNEIRSHIKSGNVPEFTEAYIHKLEIVQNNNFYFKYLKSEGYDEYEIIP